jgi:hypothetical protein
MDVEELYVSDDILEEASAAKYQMVPTKSKLRYQKELEIFTVASNKFWSSRSFFDAIENAPL